MTIRSPGKDVEEQSLSNMIFVEYAKRFKIFGEELAMDIKNHKKRKIFNVVFPVLES